MYLLLSGIVFGVVCLFVPDQCIGFLFDGGPLEWLEYIVLYLSIAIESGIFFIVVYWVYEIFKKKRNKTV